MCSYFANTHTNCTILLQKPCISEVVLDLHFWNNTYPLNTLTSLFSIARWYESINLANSSHCSRSMSRPRWKKLSLGGCTRSMRVCGVVRADVVSRSCQVKRHISPRYRNAMAFCISTWHCNKTSLHTPVCKPSQLHSLPYYVPGLY